MNKRIVVIGVVILATIISSFLLVQTYAPGVVSFLLSGIVSEDNRGAFEKVVEWLWICDFALLLSLVYLFRPKYFSAVLVSLFIGLSIYIYTQLKILPANILEAISMSDETSKRLAEEVANSTYNLIFLDSIVIVILLFILVSRTLKVKPYKIEYITKYIDTSKTGDAMGGDKLEQKLKAFQHALKDESSQSDVLQYRLNVLCKQVEGSMACLYRAVDTEEFKGIRFVKGYAFYLPESKLLQYEYGEGLAGQVAKTGENIISNNVPDGYMTVVSGLGSSSPTSLVVIALTSKEGTIEGVLELASFGRFSEDDLLFVKEISGYLLIQND